MSSIDSLFYSFEIFLDGTPNDLKDMLDEDIVYKTTYLSSAGELSKAMEIVMDFDKIIQIKAGERKDAIKDIIIKNNK